MGEQGLVKETTSCSALSLNYHSKPQLLNINSGSNSSFKKANEKTDSPQRSLSHGPGAEPKEYDCLQQHMEAPRGSWNKSYHDDSGQITDLV